MMKTRGWTMGGEDLLEVAVRGLTLDPVTSNPVLVLRVLDENRSLPIWIGLFEANAIALELEKVKTPRPLTHDLLVSVVGVLGARLARVEVRSLQEATFFATLVLDDGEREVEVDARPSDAVALALRSGAPIFVAREVLECSGAVELNDDLADDDATRKWLENLKPGDFGSTTA